MDKDKDFPSKAECFQIKPEDLTNTPKTDLAFYHGERNAQSYGEEELIEMLQGQNILEAYEALGAISKLKLKKALPALKNLAFYSDDVAIQEEAIRTIRRIGGRTAIDILIFLKSTEHKELIQELLGEDK